jgi:hypothetical protein
MDRVITAANVQLFRSIQYVISYSNTSLSLSGQMSYIYCVRGASFRSYVFATIIYDHLAIKFHIGILHAQRTIDKMFANMINVASMKEQSLHLP